MTYSKEFHCFLLTWLVWLLTFNGYAQTPGVTLDSLLETQHERIDALEAAMAPLKKQTAIVVRWTGGDQTAELQAAIDESVKRRMWLDLPDGEEYVISDTLTIPAVYGFGWRTPPFATFGKTNSNQRGCGFALTASLDFPDDGRPMVRALCANAVIRICLKGRAVGTDPLKENLVGLEWNRPVVPTGKSIATLSFYDMAVGERFGEVGNARGGHNDNMLHPRIEAFGVTSVIEQNNEQSMGIHILDGRCARCERLIDVWAGGSVYVQAFKVLSPCTALTTREGTIERPSGVGDGNGLFTFHNIKCDKQTEGKFKLLEMQRNAPIVVSCDGLLLPNGAETLIDGKAGAIISIENAQTISANSIRLIGERKKDPSDGKHKWVEVQCVIEKSRTSDTATLLTADSHHATLETPNCSGGYTNSRWETVKTVR